MKQLMKTLKNKYYFILFVLIIAFALNSCEETKVVQKVNKDSLNIAILPDQEGWKVEVHFVDSSFTRAKLKAKKSRVYQNHQETFLDDSLNVEFFSRSSNKRVSYLTADSAKIDDRTRNMLAWGKVVVIGDSTHTKLETSVLHWDNKTQKLFTTEFVKISSPREHLEGYGFESDQNLNNYKIFRVSGVQK